ncbi:hypothetical protein QTG56_11265 [Rossellomorea sp. AcN35-11]|nr:hypothetical protein [Rossellomorea aquimaris]WJV31444.1 hypothetical protein QTG56_11265 [Rossellomorea sp. AcN35-11]
MPVNRITIGLMMGVLFVGLISCSTKVEENAAPHENEKYQSEIRVAWEFVKNKGWDEWAKGDWRNASIEVTDTRGGHLLNGEPHRDEVVKVSFEPQENSINGVPQIFVDLHEQEVIGYVPAE